MQHHQGCHRHIIQQKVKRTLPAIRSRPQIVDSLPETGRCGLPDEFVQAVLINAVPGDSDAWHPARWRGQGDIGHPASVGIVDLYIQPDLFQHMALTIAVGEQVTGATPQQGRSHCSFQPDLVIAGGATQRSRLPQRRDTAWIMGAAVGMDPAGLAHRPACPVIICGRLELLVHRVSVDSVRG